MYFDSSRVSSFRVPAESSLECNKCLPLSSLRLQHRVPGLTTSAALFYHDASRSLTRVAQLLFYGAGERHLYRSTRVRHERIDIFDFGCSFLGRNSDPVRTCIRSGFSSSRPRARAINVEMHLYGEENEQRHTVLGAIVGARLPNFPSARKWTDNGRTPE